MDDQLLNRIATVCGNYRGARWGLSFDSAEGGEWSMSIISASEIDESGDPIDNLMAHVTGQRAKPVFAMRCSSLEVIAEALESWHAHTVMKDL